MFKKVVQVICLHLVFVFCNGITCDIQRIYYSNICKGYQLIHDWKLNTHWFTSSTCIAAFSWFVGSMWEYLKEQLSGSKQQLWSDMKAMFRSFFKVWTKMTFEKNISVTLNLILFFFFPQEHVSTWLHWLVPPLSSMSVISWFSLWQKRSSVFWFMCDPEWYTVEEDGGGWWRGWNDI